MQGLVAYGKTAIQEEVLLTGLFPHPTTSFPLNHVIQYAPYFKQPNLSAILLAIAGTRLFVSTVIFTDEIYTDELLSLAPHLGPHGPDNVLRLHECLWQHTNIRSGPRSYTKTSWSPPAFPQERLELCGRPPQPFRLNQLNCS